MCCILYELWLWRSLCRKALSTRLQTQRTSSSATEKLGHNQFELYSGQRQCNSLLLNTFQIQNPCHCVQSIQWFELCCCCFFFVIVINIVVFFFFLGFSFVIWKAAFLFGLWVRRAMKFTWFVHSNALFSLAHNFRPFANTSTFYLLISHFLSTSISRLLSSFFDRLQDFVNWH